MKALKVKEALKHLFQKEELKAKNELHKQFLISGTQNSRLKSKVLKLQNLKNELEVFLSKTEQNIQF